MVRGQGFDGFSYTDFHLSRIKEHFHISNPKKWSLHNKTEK